jgi:nickel superoxide dismutase
MRFPHRLFAPARRAYAHCDIPCGVYDPDQARIEAESCYKILEKYHASNEDHFKDRCIIVKEQRAELAKQHLDILWHDYFKPEHAQKYPQLHELFWQAAKQASKVKQTDNLAEARKLIELIDRIADIWEKTGGPEQTRLKKALAA